MRLRQADLDYLFERRLPYSKEERIIEVAESKVGSSTEDEPNEDIAAKYVSKKQACDLLGVCNATAKGKLTAEAIRSLKALNIVNQQYGLYDSDNEKKDFLKYYKDTAGDLSGVILIDTLSPAISAS